MGHTGMRNTTSRALRKGCQKNDDNENTTEMHDNVRYLCTTAL